MKKSNSTSEGSQTKLRRIFVQTPASVANLGAGYDCLALAIDLFNDYELYYERTPRVLSDSIEELRFDISGPFAPPELVSHLSGKGNYFVVAMKKTWGFLAADSTEVLQGEFPEQCFYIKQKVRIPAERGLGSSSSACVAGVIAGIHLFFDFNPKAKFMYGAGSRTLDRADFLDAHNSDVATICVTIAASVDNCVDNICAAYAGGLTEAISTERRRQNLTYFKQEVTFTGEAVDETLRIVSCIPQKGIATREAKDELEGKQYSIEQAAFNIQRTARLIRAFRLRRYELLSDAVEDRLHQEARLNKFYRSKDTNHSLDFERLCESVVEAGAYGVFIAGAGSTISAIANKQNSEAVATEFRRTYSALAPDSMPIEEMLISAPMNNGYHASIEVDVSLDEQIHGDVASWYSKLQTCPPEKNGPDGHSFLGL